MTTMPSPAATTRRAPGKLTWTGLAIVALAAAVLSFTSLRSLAIICGTPTYLAWLLPVAIDAAAAVATRIWLHPASPGEVRGYARRWSLFALALSVAGNGTAHALAAYLVTPPWWAVVVVAAVPPAMLGAVVHLASMVVSQEPEQEKPAEEPEPPADLAGRVAYWVAREPDIGRIKLAKELGVSEHQARQLLAQARQGTPTLHAVEEREG
jgi:hypothetical protein